MNINEQAIHDLLTRQIDLLRFERSLARDVLRQLARMREDVEERLRRRDLAELNRRELERLLADISAILAHYYGLIGNDMAKVQQQTVEDESDWLFWWLGALAADFALSGNVKPLSDTARADIGKNVLTGGLTLGEALASLRRNLFESLMRTVRLAARLWRMWVMCSDSILFLCGRLRALGWAACPIRYVPPSVRQTVWLKAGGIFPYWMRKQAECVRHVTV